MFKGVEETQTEDITHKEGGKAIERSLVWERARAGA
jgi:hypothetical protein